LLLLLLLLLGRTAAVAIDAVYCTRERVVSVCLSAGHVRKPAWTDRDAIWM